ncbi:Hypothetical predicted protein, partial [Paramuricea clavata]
EIFLELCQHGEDVAELSRSVAFAKNRSAKSNTKFVTTAAGVKLTHKIPDDCFTNWISYYVTGKDKPEEDFGPTIIPTTISVEDILRLDMLEMDINEMVRVFHPKPIIDHTNNGMKNLIPKLRKAYGVCFGDAGRTITFYVRQSVSLSPQAPKEHLTKSSIPKKSVWRLRLGMQAERSRPTSGKVSGFLPEQKGEGKSNSSTRRRCRRDIGISRIWKKPLGDSVTCQIKVQHQVRDVSSGSEIELQGVGRCVCKLDKLL